MDCDLDLLRRGIDNVAQISHLIPPRCATLNLHGNSLLSLQGLPTKAMTQLRELNLSSNNLITCELPELSLLPSLTYLDLSANRIDSLVLLPFLPGLKSLSVAFNSLTSLNGISCDNTPDLTILDARGNFVQTATQCESLFTLKSLHELKLGGRQANPVCEKGAELLSILDGCDNLESLDDIACREWRLVLVSAAEAKERSAQEPYEEEKLLPRREEVEMEEATYSREEHKENASLDSQISISTPKFDEISRRFRAQRLDPKSTAQSAASTEGAVAELIPLIPASAAELIHQEEGTQTEAMVDAAVQVSLVVECESPTDSSEQQLFDSEDDAPAQALESPSSPTPSTRVPVPSPLLSSSSLTIEIPPASPLEEALSREVDSAAPPHTSEEPQPTAQVSRDGVDMPLTSSAGAANADLQQQLSLALSAASTLESQLLHKQTQLESTQSQLEEVRLQGAKTTQHERQRAEAASRKVITSAVEVATLRREAAELRRQVDTTTALLETVQAQTFALEQSSEASSIELVVTREALANEKRIAQETTTLHTEHIASLSTLIATEQATVLRLTEKSDLLSKQLNESERAAQENLGRAEVENEKKLREALSQRDQAMADAKSLREMLAAAEVSMKQQHEVALQSQLEDQRSRSEREFLIELNQLIAKRDSRESKLTRDAAESSAREVLLEAEKQTLTERVKELAICVQRLQLSLQSVAKQNKELRRQQDRVSNDLQEREAAIDDKLAAAAREMAELTGLLEASKQREAVKVAKEQASPSAVEADELSSELALHLRVRDAQLADQALEISALKAKLSAATAAAASIKENTGQSTRDEMEKEMQEEFQREIEAERAAREELQEEFDEVLVELLDLQKQADMWKKLAQATEAYKSPL